MKWLSSILGRKKSVEKIADPETSGAGDDDKVLLTSQEREGKYRTRIFLYISLGLLGFFVVAYVWSSIDIFSGGEQKERAKRKTAEPKNAVKNEVLSNDKIDKKWQDVWESKFMGAEEEKKHLLDKVDKLEKAYADLSAKKGGEGQGSGRKSSSSQSYPEEKVPVPPSRKGNYQEPGPSCQAAAAPVVPTQYQHPAPEKVSKPVVVPQYSPQPSFKRFDFSKEVKTSRNEINDIDVPMGIATAVTLTGTDAPTFAWGQADPQPVYASVETDLLSAGDKAIPLKGCTVLASANGAVSSERAMPRLVKMDCRDKKGNLYSGNVEGWLIGDDGKIGLKGVMVSRQGAVLSKAFMAGVLDGVASIIKAQSSTLSVSPLGTTQSIDPSKAAQAGLAQGGINSAEKLQSFYLKIAEQIYPIIEVLPGRKATILFKGGQKLARVRRDMPVEEVKVAKTETKSEVVRVESKKDPKDSSLLQHFMGK